MALEAQTLHPLHLVVWAGIEEVLKDSQLAGLIALGRAIAGSLPGENLDEKLATFEGGTGNRDVITHPSVSGRFVRLKRDIFTSECCGLPWSKQTSLLLDRYNAEVPRGGAALHPLHIVMHEVHRGLGNIVDLATRDVITGQAFVSAYGLQRTGLAKGDVERLLGEGAILYWVME
jgi:hypothetical protein